MGISDMRMSERKPDNTLLASELFTDRENPQEAFERKFRLINQYRKDAYAVLCFYGIGGVGKTSLQNKLIRLMNHEEGVNTILSDEIDGYYARFDFGADSIEHDKLTILASIRNQLVRTCRDFDFSLFDTAMLMYYEKLGVEKKYDKETSLLIEKSPLIKASVDILGAIPGVGFVSNILQGLDTLIATAKNIKIRSEEEKEIYKNTLYKINYYQPSELIDHIQDFFALDLKISLSSDIQKPIVIFLDTYEEYMDDLNSDTLRLDTDAWLRKGPNSLIQSVPGILWVVMGREKLTWREDDSCWGEELGEDIPLSNLNDEDKDKLADSLLEQHLLGDLSETDALIYLGKAGINDTELGSQLYLLTHGTPIFLDICVKHHNNLIRSGVEPSIDDFGNDFGALLNRYLKNMPEHYRNMLYVMSIVESWTDDEFNSIAEGLSHNEWYSVGRYEDFIKHSFIRRTEEGKCYVHDTVRTACVKQVDTIKRQEIHRLAIQIKKDLDSLIRHSTYEGIEYKECFKNWKKICNALGDNDKVDRYDLNVQSLANLYDRVSRLFPRTAYEYIVRQKYAYWLGKSGRIKEAGLVVRSGDIPSYEKNECISFLKADLNKAYVLYLMGLFEDAFVLTKTVYKNMSTALGEDHIDTISTLADLSDRYSDLGEYAKAIEIQEKVYEAYKTKLGDDNLSTLLSLVGLGDKYSDVGEYKKALDIQKEAYVKIVDLLGEDDPTVINVLNDIGADYYDLGDYEKAIEYSKQVYDKNKKYLGEDHPDTIMALHNMGLDYFAIDEFDEALSIINKTLRLIGEIYYMKGNYEQSIEILLHAHSLFINTLGEEHPDSIATLIHLGRAYSAIDKYQEAIQIDKRVYEIRKKKYGDEYPYTVFDLIRIGLDYCDLEAYKKAEEIYLQVISKRDILEGEEHPFNNNTLALLKQLEERIHII